jgi:D-alanyl-D-alanine carboxypeptidase
MEGALVTGWLDLEDKRYYLGQDGARVTGWLEMEGTRYYFREDGTMARGCVEIEGINNYFTSTGACILLVNPWNYVPEAYDPDLVTLDKYANYDNMYVSRACYDDLIAMLHACKSEVSRAVVVSAYRTHEFQTKNYRNQVEKWLKKGYSQEEAERLAAQAVAVPGTSEHQLGLSVDIVDVNFPYLESGQADMPAQKWLMEHCWEYGFVLRYPKGKTDVTGIIYEPWHYRYVGLELAKELYEADLTLEEYLQNLTQ